MQKDKVLNELGFTVIRFKDEDVMKQLESVKMKIEDVIKVLEEKL
jgi:very-short-patch-repair endonuclease